MYISVSVDFLRWHCSQSIKRKGKRRLYAEWVVVCVYSFIKAYTLLFYLLEEVVELENYWKHVDI